MKFKKSRVLILFIIFVLILAAVWHTGYNAYLKIAYPIKYGNIVEKYSSESGVDPSLVYAVIKNESGFRPNAKSRIGALGLMQLTPETLDWAQSKDKVKKYYGAEDLYTPEVNVKYGTIVLSRLLSEFKREDTALAAYHAGRSNVKKWLTDPSISKDGVSIDRIPFADTRVYVRKVLEAQEMYQNLYKVS